MRNQFNTQLNTLHVELIKMGALCEESIAAAMKSVLDEDETMAERAAATEREIDRKERDIEALCMKLLLQQQPVARDLRAISSALRMISDMERIGDQASDIAEISKFLKGCSLTGRVHLKDMAVSAVQMVTDSVDAFVKDDLELAKAVMAQDDVVDGYFRQIKDEVTALIVEDSRNGEFCIDLMMIAKYLERIGDHAVNIAEWVEYSITGARKHGDDPA